MYDGMYGKWSVEDEDVKEVWAYRFGISGAVAAATVLALPSLLPFIPWLEEAVRGIQNPVTVLGAFSMGISLFLIHVYVTPLKRFVQILWAIGLASGLGIMFTQDEPIISYVATHPSAMWGVGFIFASLTGVAVKEGLCYGKLEAAALALLTPLLCLSHLASPGVEEGSPPILLLPWVLSLLVFAGRKYSQEVKDDIGDKSVFMLQAVPEDKREEWLRKRVEDGLYTPAPRWDEGGEKF